MKNIFQNTYALSMDDLMGMWIESFHPFGAILVVWDAGSHFELLRQCGIQVNSTEGYDNKALTVEFLDVFEAYAMLDKIESSGISPYMQVYLDGKLVSDNV